MPFANTSSSTISKAKQVSSWDISFSTPPLHWTRGKAMLIGDAVHSVSRAHLPPVITRNLTPRHKKMFPTTGQGACQCFEDAAALGVFLDNLNTTADLATHLQLFQSFRRKRVVLVHATSGFLPGQESRITEQVARLLPGGKPLSSPVDTLELSNRCVFLPKVPATYPLFFETRNANNARHFRCHR
jgi:2-polyprenyl-6-methoxyphenol hydroxylase-like FAD-dependent oxidoreductase